MMSGRFVFCRVLQADAGTREIYKGQDWPECWLIAEWPPGAPEPTRYWLSTLPATTRRAGLVRAAKQRWRIDVSHPWCTRSRVGLSLWVASFGGWWLGPAGAGVVARWSGAAFA